MKGEKKERKSDCKYQCKECNFYSNDKTKFICHINTDKHKRRRKGEKGEEKSDWIYRCDLCNFYSNDKTKYSRHINTEKHKKEKTASELSTTEIAIQPLEQKGKSSIKLMDKIETLDTKIKILMELLPHMACSNVTNNITNNNVINHNSNNVTNNNQRISQNQINIFLNEKCGDAMSIQEFAKQLTFTIDDVLMKKQDALVSVINKNLNPLNVTERPVHCSNVERRKWHVKDETDGWTNDDGSRIVSSVSNSLLRKSPSQYSDMFPDWSTNPNRQDEYTKIVKMTSMDMEPKAEGRVLKTVGETNKLDLNKMDM